MAVPHELGSGLGHATEVLVRAIGVFVAQATQMVDPGRGIDDDHGSSLYRSLDTRLVKVSIPMDFASESPDAGLCASLNQQAQSLLDYGPFDRCSTALHCLVQ
jgi:hypothetical protein